MKQIYTTVLFAGLLVLSSHKAWTQADQNVILGYQAGLYNTVGGGNTLIGYQSGLNTSSGNNNVFIGNQVGYANTTGYVNVFIGNRAGFSNTTSIGNVFLGNQTGLSNTTGSFNLFMGNATGQNTTTGSGNTAIGDGSFLNNTTGQNNTSIGRYAGYNLTTGSSNTFIGVGASVPQGSGAINNATAIGYNALVTASNALILGNSVNVGIGNTAPNNRLEITQGTAGNSGLRLTNLTSSSPASLTSQYKFLTVNASGDVVLGSLNGSAREGVSSTLWSATGDYVQNANTGGVIIGDGVAKTPSDYNLFVSKGILTEKVKVAVKNTADWSDKVFESGYSLRGLPEVAGYIKTHKHLPGIPSAQEMVEQGNDLHQTDAKLLEKIEELTLYLIEQRNELQSLRQQNRQIKKRMVVLERKSNH